MKYEALEATWGDGYNRGYTDALRDMADEFGVTLPPERSQLHLHEVMAAIRPNDADRKEPSE